MKNTFALLIALLTLQLTVKAQGIEFVHDKSFDEIRAMAKAQNKLIFMAWCQIVAGSAHRRGGQQ